MIALAMTATTIGVDGHLIRLEADSTPGKPSFTLIGLPDRALGESRERVRAAIFHSGLLFPAGRILVNLAPADLRKIGMGFDVPLALALLAIDEQVPRAALKRFVILGELALDGAVRPVGGILPMVLGAKDGGYASVIVPRANAAEAGLVAEMEIFAIDHLSDAVAILLGHERRYRYTRQTPKRVYTSGEDFAEIRGQLVAKRALEIAAAGGHHVRLTGPPGCGKTMLARRLPSILPLMSESEVLTTTAIRSANGSHCATEGLLYERPFRTPHHTITATALVGGGQRPLPGEVSLAHHGVLFLDEFAEFSRHTLEVLRQPLEDGVVTIARSAGSVTYPARFSLLVAMNPCPCGMRGERRGDCRCDDQLVARYLARVSGPILDRIDIHLRLQALPLETLLQRPQGESSSVIRARVVAARERQLARYGTAAVVNAAARVDFTAPDLIEPGARAALQRYAERTLISARSFSRILRTARTIADLANRDRILAEDVDEAFSYRN